MNYRLIIRCCQANGCCRQPHYLTNVSIVLHPIDQTFESGRKRLVVTDEQLEKWLAAKLDDSKWVVKIRARSDQAKAQMRRMGLL